MRKDYTIGKCCSCDYDICGNCLEEKKIELDRVRGKEKLKEKETGKDNSREDNYKRKG